MRRGGPPSRPSDDSVKASRAQAERALRQPGPDVRLILLHGPDEAGSRVLAAELAAAMGPEAERIDLAPAILKADPARLADEAAAGSLFGGPRHILVEGAGDESLAAIEALLAASAAGNPVVAITGTLRATSRLLKLVVAAPDAVAFASYPPGADEMEKLAMAMGRGHGLRIDAQVARRLAVAAGGDRAILAGELEKYALYLDAAPERPMELDHDAVDRLSADSGDADLDRLVGAVLGGAPGAAEAEIARLAAVGTSGVPLVRAVQRRLLLLAELRGQVERGNAIGTVVGRPASGVRGRDQEAAVSRQLQLWTADRLATALARIAEAGRAAMSARGPGTLAIDVSLNLIARNAARAR